ncbi:Os01g0180050, partial [Oryza sativa Japonica Group]
GAVDGRAREERGALPQRPLGGAVGQAVPPVAVARHGVRAGRRLAGEEVVREGEVLEARQLAHRLRYRPREQVVRDVELLHLPHPGHRRRQRAGEPVEAHVEHRHLSQHPDLRRQAGAEARVDEQDLVERPGHVAEARREAAAEAVVREDDDGDRRVAEVVREVEAEAVVVEEDGVERPVEQLAGHPALEVVEAEEAEAAEGGREHAAEAVGVEVEQREVGEQAELGGQVPGDVAVVEVDAGDGDLPAIPRQRRAEHAGVVAHVGAHPVGGEVAGVGEDGLPPPRLQRHVRVPHPR